MELRQAFRAITRVQRKGDDKLMLFGTTPAGQEVVGKAMWGGQDNAELAALLYEAAIYERIINPTVASGQAANLVTMAAWLPGMAAQDFFNQVRGLAGNSADLMAVAPLIAGKRVWTLVTRTPANLVGDAAGNMAGLTTDQAARALFQMAYTIQACADRDLVHNDLHMGNWLVSRPGARVAYALSPNWAYIDPGDVSLSLYDWDRGYSPGLGDNPLLVKEDGFLCRNYSQCNALEPRRDMGQTVCEWATSMVDWRDLCNHSRVSATPSVYPATARGPMCRAARTRTRHICLPSREEVPCASVANAIDAIVVLPGVREHIVDMRTPQGAAAVRALPLVVRGGVDRSRVDATLQAAGPSSVPVQMPPAVDTRSRLPPMDVQAPSRRPVDTGSGLPPLGTAGGSVDGQGGSPGAWDILDGVGMDGLDQSLGFNTSAEMQMSLGFNASAPRWMGGGGSVAVQRAA